MRGFYDGSFEGFLSLVHEVYYKKISLVSIEKGEPKQLFLDGIYLCTTDNSKAQVVLQALKKKFQKEHFETILVLFMCDSAAFEMDLLNYIILGFKDQKNLQNINYSAVFNLLNLQKKYFHAYHKMSGFLRFSELEDGSLYAPMQSQYNLVFHLGKHFLKRFNNQEFYIHDKERSLVFMKTEQFLGVYEVKDFDAPRVSEKEEQFVKLWQQFYKSVTIESRINKKLQTQLVPLLYRTYMSEFF